MSITSKLVALPLLMGVAALALAKPDRTDGKWSAMYQYSFTSGKLDEAFLEFSGDAPKDVLRWEKEGLRITLPANNGPGRPVGVAFRFPVKGDFEYRAEFELLDLSPSRTNLATGVNVYVTSDSPAKAGIWLGKMLDPKKGAIFHTGARANVDANRRETLVEVKLPTETAQGMTKIRLIRKGPQLLMWAGDKAPKEIAKVILGTDDLAMFRLAAEPGNQTDALVDIRLVEMFLGADEFVGAGGKKESK